MVNFTDAMRVDEWVKRKKTMLQMNKQTLHETAVQCEKETRLHRVSVNTIRSALEHNGIEYRGGAQKRQINGLRSKINEQRDVIREAYAFLQSGTPEHLRNRMKDLMTEVIEVPIAI